MNESRVDCIRLLPFGIGNGRQLTAAGAAGRRIACAKSGSAFDTPDTNSYLYNSRSELTNAVASADANYKYSYLFDDIGNRKASAERGTNVTYADNNLNQYTQLNRIFEQSEHSNIFSPVYDPDGNQTLVKTATGIWQVTYNGENRPIFWTCVESNNQTISNQTIVSMSYDRMGRRVTKNNQRFVYDGYIQIANYHSPTPTLNSNFFIWDPTEPVATRPLAWTTPTTNHQSPITGFYAHDGNKNVSEVIASDGTLAAHYEYAPFGALTAQRGVSAATNPWRFSSEYAEDDTATVYYNYRHYEPVTGRWLQRDPRYKIGGYDLYGFVENRVFNAFDEKGTVASSIPSPHSNCEEYKDYAMESDLNKAMRKKLKDSGCREPDIVCEDCCKYKGYYTPSENQISICEGKVKGDDEHDKKQDVVRTLYHELMHAYQKCKGADPNGCENSICQEIDAYYNSTDFVGLGVWVEDDRRADVRKGVKISSCEACGCKENDEKCKEDKIGKKFDVMYEKCKGKWNERLASDDK